MESFPYQSYYIAASPGTAQPPPSHKDGAALTPAGHTHNAPAAPPSYASTAPPVPCVPDATRQANLSASNEGPWGQRSERGGGGVLNPLPPHYAPSQGQFVYVQSGAMPSTAGPPLVVSQSPININILAASTSMMYPAMSMPTAAAATSNMTFYLPTDASQQQQHQQQQRFGSISATPNGHGFYVFQSAAQQQPQQQQQQQQQQHPQQTALLNTNTSLQNPSGGSAAFPYWVLSNQQVDPSNMASVSGYPTFQLASSPHAPLLPPPTALAASQMSAYMMAPSTPAHLSVHLAGANTSGSTPASRPTRPLPLQHRLRPTHVAANAKEDGAPVRGKQQLPASEIAPSSSSSSVGKAITKSGGGGGKWRQGSTHVDGSAVHRSASLPSPPPPVAQGLPYDEDPVEIDTSKRQLIVNYLPQRLTDERFRELFRPYGELMEEESHIIYDFRHHKTVPVSKPGAHASDVAPAVPSGVLRAATVTPSASAVTTTGEAAPPSIILSEDNASANASLSNHPAATATRSVPRSKGYGFVYYKDGASTEAAIKELNGKDVDGKRIKVRYADQQRGVEPCAIRRASEDVAVTHVQLSSAAIGDGSDAEEDEEDEEELFHLEAFTMDDE